MDILFRDAKLLAVDKPPGLVVHRGLADDDDAVADRVREIVGARVHAVHRLDRGTSGVLLFALDPETARALQEAFAGGAVEKTYVCLVRGIPDPRAGVIDHPIPKGEGKPRVAALSEYRVLSVHLGRYAFVEVRPKTGRFHQVRRHMKHIACPLIGDTTYGKSEHNRFWRARGLARLALHAAALAFTHPATGARLQIEAPLPQDLVRATDPDLA